MIFAAVPGLDLFPRPIVTSSSKSAVRAGRVLSGIAVAFLTLDAAMKAARRRQSKGPYNSAIPCRR